MAKSVKAKKVKTYIEGVDDVIKTLVDMGDAAADVLDSAAMEGAELVLADAKRRVPVDKGKLRDSLIVKKTKVKNPKVKGEYTVTKKSGAQHFAPVELGTSKMAAQPFLRPALDENMGAVAKKVNDTVLKALGRVK